MTAWKTRPRLAVSSSAPRCGPSSVGERLGQRGEAGDVGEQRRSVDPVRHLDPVGQGLAAIARDVRLGLVGRDVGDGWLQRSLQHDPSGSGDPAWPPLCGLAPRWSSGATIARCSQAASSAAPPWPIRPSPSRRTARRSSTPRVGRTSTPPAGRSWSTSATVGGEIAAAMAEQAGRVAYAHGSAFTTEPLERYAAEVGPLLPVDDPAIYPVSGGSEAIETALKMARAYHLARREPDRDVVIARWGSYHGNSLGALDLSGRPPLRRPYEPWLGRFRHVSAPYAYRAGLPGRARPRRRRRAGRGARGGDRRRRSAVGSRHSSPSRSSGRRSARSCRPTTTGRPSPRSAGGTACCSSPTRS